MRRIFAGTAAGILLATFAGGAAAQNAEGGWYGGVSVGQSKISFDNSSLAVAGATASSISKDETDTAWKLFAGYRFGRHLAVEGGYTDFGKFSATNTVTAPATGSFSATFKSSGPHVEAVGILPLGSSNFSLFGKAGAMYTTTKASATSSGAVIIVGSRNQDHSELNFKAGIGASYDITRNIAVRIEAEQVFDVGDKNTTGEGDIRMFSAGVVFKF